MPKVPKIAESECLAVSNFVILAIPTILAIFLVLGEL